MKKNSTLPISILLMFMMLSGVAFSQTTEFVYQGQLQNSSIPANGIYDFEFKLFDLVSSGTQQGATLQRSAAVANGIFSVPLDFGAANLPGADRFLDIAVRLSGGGAFTALTPRQKLNSAPYSVRSLNAATADSVTAGGIPAGSGNYVQNTTSPQATSNFNISGNGTAGGTLRGNTIKADTQFDLGSDRIIFRNGSNFFVGPFTGSSTTGTNNSFFGNTAGFANTTGSNNTFLGLTAGTANVSGSGNSFFGTRVGSKNMSGSSNAFFGSDSGRDNVSGTQNAFFGTSSGLTSLGFGNSFFGDQAGALNTTGNFNVFIGRSSGQANVDGSSNTLLGATTNLGSGNLSFATAIGANAVVNSSNTVVLGRNLDTVQIPGTLSVSGTLGANIFNATTQYNIAGERVVGGGPTSSIYIGVDAGAASTGASNTFVGFQAGSSVITSQQNTFVGRSSGANATGGANSFFGANTGLSTTGLDNTFIGAFAGFSNTTGMRNAFVGHGAGQTNTAGNDNTLIGHDASVGSNSLTFATAIGADAVVTTSNTVVLGRGTDVVSIAGTQLNLGGSRFLNNSGTQNTFAGVNTGAANTTGTDNTFVGYVAGDNSTGDNNSFFGSDAGGSTTLGSGNTFVGSDAGDLNSTGSSNTAIGNGADVGLINLSFATAIGAGAVVPASNTIALGRADGSDKVRVFGLGAAGTTQLCRNANNEIAACSSSLRYKTDIRPFNFGLDLVKRLRPITFSWKDGGLADMGLGAEDVAAIEPLLVTYNKAGQVEGVKYDRIGVVLVNAVKQQQRQIESQEQQLDQQNELIKKQQAEIDALKATALEVGALKNLICSQNPAAVLCKPLN